MEASYASEPVVLKEVERVFDTARPTRIDPTRSYAMDESFFIAHTDDCWGDIDIEVGEDREDLMSELGRRQIGAAEFGKRWTQQLAAEIEQIIRGHYQNRLGPLARQDHPHHRHGPRRQHHPRCRVALGTAADTPRHLIRGRFTLDYGCAPD